MLTYPEFLRNYFDMDTSPLKIDPLDTSYKPLKVSINPKEAYKEYCKEESKIEKVYKDYLKTKQDRFRRRLK